MDMQSGKGQRSPILWHSGFKTTKLKMQSTKLPPFTRLRMEVLSHRASIWAPISHACSYLTVE
jgi:hypothetical protein